MCIVYNILVYRYVSKQRYREGHYTVGNFEFKKVPKNIMEKICANVEEISQISKHIPEN